MIDENLFKDTPRVEKQTSGLTPTMRNALTWLSQDGKIVLALNDQVRVDIGTLTGELATDIQIHRGLPECPKVHFAPRANRFELELPDRTRTVIGTEIMQGIA